VMGAAMKSGRLARMGGGLLRKSSLMPSASGRRSASEGARCARGSPTVPYYAAQDLAPRKLSRTGVGDGGEG